MNSKKNLVYTKDNNNFYCFKYFIIELQNYSKTVDTPPIPLTNWTNILLSGK